MSSDKRYSLIPLRDLIFFPNMISPVFVGRAKSIKALEEAQAKDSKLFFTLQKDTNTENPKFEDVYKIGTVAKLLQFMKLPDGTVKILAEGLQRGQLYHINDDGESLTAEIEILPEELDADSINIEVYKATLIKTFEKYINYSGKLDSTILEGLKDIDDPIRLTYTIAAAIPIKNDRLQDILEINSLSDRVHKILETLRSEIELIKLDNKIKSSVKQQMSKAQKEYYLGEQVKAINKELGRDDDLNSDLDDIGTKLKELPLPQHVQEKADKEYKKLKMMSPMSAESTVVRNFLDWITSMPWGEYTEDSLDINNAEEVLNRDHYGLEKPKERILEFLSVKKLAENMKGPILCFVGPPGVGKTSLARSIAEAMGRKFVRMSLGGVRDEAEIRGHRRTYIGSMPGKIIQSIKKAGSMNPLFLLDEIDKLSSDFRGDPASALLEALDPEQNSTFVDHYLEVDFDVSKVMFITTANSENTIPHALLDRMEIIRIPGYTEKEKFNISRQYLVPKQLKEHNLDDERVKISDSAVTEIIRYYTKEAGVRSLEREIGSVIRKSAKKIVTGEAEGTIQVNGRNIEKFLGVKKFRMEQIKTRYETGVATGLAWTPFGGDTLQIEVAVFQGTGKLIITGHLGEVMQESAKTALTVVKSRSVQYGIPAYKFSDFDIHVHVPEGAVPKDGPSAGITLATAILSALSEKEVDCKVAMTGEITLRGKVLPIGGVKEKVLAAHRAGVKTVILPEDNKKDLTEIPRDVKNIIRFIFVESIDQVLETVIKNKRM